MIYADEIIHKIVELVDESKFVPKTDIGYGMRNELLLEIIGANGKKDNVMTSCLQDGEIKRMTSVYVRKRRGKHED